MPNGGDDGKHASPCLREELVVAFVDGDLGEAARAAIEQHLDGCISCFEWVAGAVRASLLGSRRALAETVPLGETELPPDASLRALAGPGESIGRYRIVERLGQGAMGVVFRAFDPMLERHVALKIIRSERPSPGLRMRALGEAQALARLRHPNTIAVHDVGFVGEQVFVALELVEGETLASWLRRQPRRWRAVRDLFVQAAAGVAAAHDAGLVHRDFKPENVLLGDGGARVVVTDFGLVCSMNVDGTTAGAGELAGTPAFMAPEQFEGGPVDPRTDVFNFCAAMHEAIFGQPAFAGESVAERRRAVLAGELRRPPVDARAPAWLRRALLRGLARNPDARWPSMRELTFALRRDQRVRRGLGAAALVGVLLVVALSAAGLTRYRSPVAACRRRAASIGALWAPPQQRRVREAFARTGLPFVERAATAVDLALRRYDAAWSRAYEDTCDATYRDGAQSLQAFELRVACLDTQRDGLAQMIRIFDAADASVVENAASAVSELPSPAACLRDRPALERVVPPPLAGRVAAARRQLAQARSYEIFGKLDDAERLAAAVRPAVRALAFTPLTAEAELRDAYLLRARGRNAEAERAFLRAFDAAEGSGDDRLRADIAAELVELVGTRAGRFAEGERWTEQAQAIWPRLDAPLDDERAMLTEKRGMLRRAEGKLADAEADLRRAWELRSRTAAPYDPRPAQTQMNLGAVFYSEGDYARAGDMFRQSHDRLTAILGAEHPLVLSLEMNLAMVEYARGHFHEAIRRFRTLLPAQEKLLGEHHPNVVAALDNLSDSEASIGDYVASIEHARSALAGAIANDPNNPAIAHLQLSLALGYSQNNEPERARPLAEEALARNVAVFGRDHPIVGRTEYQLARIALDVHDVATARARGERALALLERAYGPKHHTVADALDLLGVADYESGDWAAALDKHTRALAVVEPTGDSSLPDVLTHLGRAQLEMGRRAAARATLERAHTLRQTIEGDPQMTALTDFALARSLDTADLARARTLVASAVKGFIAGGARFAREAQQARTWLHDHPDKED